MKFSQLVDGQRVLWQVHKPEIRAKYGIPVRMASPAHAVPATVAVQRTASEKGECVKYYLCQDFVKGEPAMDLHGHKASWATVTLLDKVLVWTALAGCDKGMCDPDAPGLITVTARGLIRSNRVMLLRAIEKTLPTLKTADPVVLADLFAKIRKDPKQHYLAWSQDDPTRVSYAPKPQLRYVSASRVRTQLGRYLRRHVEPDPLKLPDKQLERLVYRVIGGSPTQHEIELLTGDAIVAAYEAGLGQSSCMTGSASVYTKFYAANPKKVALAVLTLKGSTEPCARALLWTCEDGTRVLDRIYPNSGAHVDIFYKWAAEEGIVTREGNSMPNSGDVALANGAVYEVIMHRVSTGYPYLDTFRYGRLYAGNKVLLSNSPDNGMEFVYASCSGGCDPLDEADEEDERSCCYNCGDRVEESDEVTNDAGDIFCTGCYERLYTHCDRCDQEFHMQADTEHQRLANGALWCGHCAENYATNCVLCEDLIPTKDIQYVRNQNGTEIPVCETCYESSTQNCTKCDERFAKRALDNGLCPDCVEEAAAADTEEASADALAAV